MISSDVIRGYNDTIILCLLMEHDSYCYELSKEIKSRTEGKYIIKETTLYSAVARLESNGFICSYDIFTELGKKRTYYSVTKTGRDYYAEKCEEWHLTEDVIGRFVKQ